jgi:peptide/nickel transport system substrate-binding protein
MDGTGPYCFQSWEPRNQTVATRHEAYKWGPPVYENRGPAKFQRVVWKIVPEEAARLATMASGQGDVTYTMPDQYLPQLGRMPNMQVLRPEANLSLFYLGFKTTRPHVADVRVRTALNMAVNRQQLVDALWFGNGEVASTYIHPKTPDFDPTPPRPAVCWTRPAGAWAMTGSATRTATS